MATTDSTLNLLTNTLPLDSELCVLDADEVSFLRLETRIDTDEALKKHLLDVQAKAYSIHPYPCIRYFAFARSKVFRMPAYQKVLKLGRERDNAIFLDIGCCFGDNIRRVVADGFPIDKVLGSDIEQDFWNIGHETFRSTPETFPVPFVKGDVFDSSNLEVHPPLDGAPETPMPALNSLVSLDPLRGHVSVIYAAALFHLFNEEKQLGLACALASLLSFEPGSIIFGYQAGKFAKEVIIDHGTMFFHSPESWKELWDGKVFGKGKVEVEAFLKPIEPSMVGSFGQGQWLVWSVTRL